MPINELVRTTSRTVYHRMVKYSALKIKNRSSFENIYYCCTQRTGSQWFRSIFRDEIFFKYTGLRPVYYIKLGLNEAQFRKPFPANTMVIHLYISYQSYLSIPKPDKRRAFFILRDPRDIVVSWYFAMRYSHVPIDDIPRYRLALEPLTVQEGLKYCINQLADIGLFEAQRSWILTAGKDEDVRVFRYEEFARDNRAFLKKLLAYLEVSLPEAEFEKLYTRHAFKEKTGGRKQGEEQIKSHYRKGVAGDWENYFDEEIKTHFETVTGDLLSVLGYTW